MLAMSVASGGKTRTCDVRQCHLTTPTAYALLDEGTYRTTLRNQKRLWQASAYFLSAVQTTLSMLKSHAIPPVCIISFLRSLSRTCHKQVGHLHIIDNTEQLDTRLLCLFTWAIWFWNASTNAHAHVLIIVCVYSCCCWRQGMAICWY